MSPQRFQRESYRTQSGVRSPRSPGKGTGTGLGRGFDYGAFVAQHFPNEIESLARAATWQVHARHHKRKDPEPAEVQKRLEEMGWTRAQMGAGR